MENTPSHINKTEPSLDKTYSPQEIEQPLYEHWEKQGYFKPNGDTSKESYCIMIPPPNVTGSLHMGHAFQQTIMDTLIRYQRMQGKIPSGRQVLIMQVSRPRWLWNARLPPKKARPATITAVMRLSINLGVERRIRRHHYSPNASFG